MNISKTICTISFSAAALFTTAAKAEDVSDPQVLVQISYKDCYPAASIDEAMKEDFNQTVIRTDGQFGHDKAALYADAAKDSYNIVVFLDPETLIPKPSEPVACLFGKPHQTGYAAFKQSEDYKIFFQPK